MMIGYKKEKGWVCTILLHVIRKSPSPSKNRLTAILNWKKPKSVPPGIWTQDARTECSLSTGCATTLAVIYLTECRLFSASRTASSGSTAAHATRTASSRSSRTRSGRRSSRCPPGSIPTPSRCPSSLVSSRWAVVVTTSNSSGSLF